MRKIPIQKKTFWGTGYLEEDQTTGRWMETWKTPKEIGLIGARITLLTVETLQQGLDLFAAVTRNEKEDFCPADLKKDHLFYGQRDCYRRCSGIDDITLHDYLPSAYHFKILKGETLYFKGLATKSLKKEGGWDVLIDLLYFKSEKSFSKNKKIKNEFTP